MIYIHYSLKFTNKRFDYPTIKLTIEPSELVLKWNHFTLEVNKDE